MNNNNSIPKSPVFEGLNIEEYNRFLSTFCNHLSYKQGEFVCNEGDVGDTMYLIEAGKLEILINHHNHEDLDKKNVIAVIGAGSVMGEMCVFGEKKRSATVRVLEDATILNIDGQIFREKLQKNEMWALIITSNIAKILALRLMKANNFINFLYRKFEITPIKSELEHYRERFFDESLFN